MVDQPSPGLKGMLAGLVFGLLAALFALAVTVGALALPGGFRDGLRPPTDVQDSPRLLLWSVALAVLVGVLTVPLAWAPRRLPLRERGAVAVLLVSFALLLLYRDVSIWALVALPASAPALVMLVLIPRRRRDPLAKPFATPLPQLSTSTSVAVVYAVLLVPFV